MTIAEQEYYASVKRIAKALEPKRTYVETMAFALDATPVKIDKFVNEWVKESGAHIMDIRPFTTAERIFYVITYTK